MGKIVDVADVRDGARVLFNALDYERPINFGLNELYSHAFPADLYVPQLHATGDGDAVEELATQIDFAESAGSYLFTGNRGTGKTTELLRLAQKLEGLGCEVFYADMSEYLSLTHRIEISDFLISVMGALSEKVATRFGVEVGGAGFFQRTWNFLQADVRFTDVSVPAGPMQLKGALKETPLFKEQLQKQARGHTQKLIESARTFALEVVNLVRVRRMNPDAKVVFIVDSIERLRGVGDINDVREVFKSVETLFSSHSDSLSFTGLNIVYTVPPYLQALAGGLGAYYAGGRIYALPSAHIYKSRPPVDAEPAPEQAGLDKLVAIVEKRYPDYGRFITKKHLRRLAEHSGGDLRDFLRMVRLAVTRVTKDATLPLGDRPFDDAENAVRSDMLPIADDDRAWLNKIRRSHDAELPSLDKLPDFARLQQGKYVLLYRNGEDWYDVHPLIKAELAKSPPAPPAAAATGPMREGR